MIFFIGFNLLLNEFNNDVIINYVTVKNVCELTESVVFETFRNCFSEVTFLADFLFKKISNGNAGPVEMLSQSKCSFLAVRTWGTAYENSTGYIFQFYDLRNTYAQAFEA